MIQDVQVPIANKGKTCPLHKQDMSKVCHKCPLWVNVQGQHPQRDERVDRWHCSLAWLPFLMIENSNMQRQTGSAIESLRNRQAELTDTLREAAGMPPLADGVESVRTRLLPKR